MTLLGQFFLYNLLPALAVGLLAWLVLMAALDLLKIEYGNYRLPLLYVPLIKSSVVLLGAGLALPWPRPFFVNIQAQAVPPDRLLPVFLVWVGLASVLYGFLTSRSRQHAILGARPAEGEFPRLVAAMDKAIAALKNSSCKRTENGWICCSIDGPVPRARLLVSDRAASPFVLTGDADPAIIFPAALVARLTEDELTGALAHELAHLTLRQPWCYSSATLARWTGVSPVARLVTLQLRQEEEKACDDLAIAAFGNPEGYAAMLLKSYRFALEQRGTWTNRLDLAPNLLGARPVITQRIERLLQPLAPTDRLAAQRLAAIVAWCLMMAFFIS